MLKVKDKTIKLRSLFSTGPKTAEDAKLVADLANETHLSQQEVMRLRDKFVQCADPTTKQLDKNSFRNLLRFYFVQDNINWDGFYRVFDTDRTGKISFEEFVRALAVLLLGPPQQQLEMLFKVFDEDEDGSLNARDLDNLLTFLEKSNGEWPLPNSQAKSVIKLLLADSPDGKSISMETWLRVCPKHAILEALIHRNLKLQNQVFSRQVVEPVWKVYHYDDVEDYLHTGDLVLCHGREFFSRAIQLSTLSFFSHAAVLVRDPPPDIRQLYSCDPNEKLFIFESDTVTFDNRLGGGVQLVPFRKWLRLTADEYKIDGLAVVRRLHLPNRDFSKDWLTTPDGTFPKFASFMRTVVGRAYEKHRIQLVGAISGYNKADDLSTIFCSELVGACYKEMDVLPVTLLPNNCSPAAFSSKYTSKPNSPLTFMRGAIFEREVKVIIDKIKV